MPDVGPWAADGASGDGDTTGAALPPEAAAWGDDARHVFEERLAVAAELGMETAPSSLAWGIALREARRAAAGLPGGLATGPVDAVLAAFAPAGGLMFMGTLSPEQHAALTAAPDIVPRPREAVRVQLEPSDPSASCPSPEAEGGRPGEGR